jgi:hypothetical protein
MNNQPATSNDDDSWLDMALRPPTPPPSPDAGRDAEAFTRRVLAALPPPHTAAARSEQRRRLLLAGALVVGCGLAGVLAGPGLMDAARALAAKLSQMDGVLLPHLVSEIPLLAWSIASVFLGALAGWWAWARGR